MDNYHRKQYCLWCNIRIDWKQEEVSLSDRVGISHRGVNQEPEAKHVYFCSKKHRDEFRKIAERYFPRMGYSSLGWYIYNHHIVSWNPPVRDKLNDKSYHLYGY